MNVVELGPWPNVATARLFLGALVGLVPAAAVPVAGLDAVEMAEWLIAQGIGPVAADRLRTHWPQLAAKLQEDSFTAVAQSSLFATMLAQIEAAFSQTALPFVLLKGAALARGAYADAALRTMSDVDIWVQAADMPQAAVLMKGLGFKMHGGRKDRSLALQMLSQGEIQFYGQPWGMVELHWSPFPGWWLKRTAQVDETAVWQRIEPISATNPAQQLAAEDMIIQVAVHLAVNHQFGMTAVRGLIDLALTAQTRPVDWLVVAQRAHEWRVGTAVWQALDLLQQLIGLPDVAAGLKLLRPSRLRRSLLRKFVLPESVLRGQDLRDGRARFLLLLLLVDRPGDMVRLIWRTLWPEPAWLAARYQEQGGHWHHLWQVVRYGRI